MKRKRKNKTESVVELFAQKISSTLSQTDDSELQLKLQAAQHTHELRMMSMFTQFLASRQPPPVPQSIPDQAHPPWFDHTRPPPFHPNQSHTAPFHPGYSHTHFTQDYTRPPPLYPDHTHMAPFHPNQDQARPTPFHPDQGQNAPFHPDHTHAHHINQDQARPPPFCPDYRQTSTYHSDQAHTTPHQSEATLHEGYASTWSSHHSHPQTHTSSSYHDAHPSASYQAHTQPQLTILQSRSSSPESSALASSPSPTPTVDSV